ncbi:MAG: mitochondrial fission ELM1 family protein [Tahibacter sp.]
MSHAQTECWVISDGAAGNERQAIALAERLGVTIRVWRISPCAPWSWLAPRLTFAARWSMPAVTRLAFDAPWPALAIGCGRDAALYTRCLRRWSKGFTFTVQILDPRIAPRHFDLVVAPQHDGLRGTNVLTPLGSLNPIDAEWLAQAAEASSELADLPQPRTAVLIGASRGALQIDESWCDALVATLRRRHMRDGGSFLVTTSRRTPDTLAARLRDGFAAFPGRFWSGSQDGPNPYAGFLAQSQAIVVSPDSVNMLSEACAVGVPVYTLLQNIATSKLALLHRALMDAGQLRLLDAPTDSETPAPPALRETAAIADDVRRRWLLHNSR